MTSTKNEQPDYWCSPNMPPIEADDDAINGRCPICKDPLEQGYGMMGGGCGFYHFCPETGEDGQFHWMEKWEDRGP